MRRNYWLALALILIVPAMLFTTGCSKKVVKADSDEVQAEDQQDQDAADAQREAEEQARLEAERLKAEQDAQAVEQAKMAFTAEKVYFEFDSATLLPAGQDVLTQKAEYVANMLDASITIEGHCDERGTDAYNLALGERRAQAAKSFLVNLGVNESQITTISYGEERPEDPASNEDAWAKNRRAEFRLDQ